MKHQALLKLLIFSLLLNSLFAFGQEKKIPTYYLNSKKVELKELDYLNPNSIDSVKVLKKEGIGSISISTKKKTVNFLSIDDILKNHTTLNSSDGNVLIRINGKIVDNITDIKIDDTFFIYVEIKKLSENQYLSNQFRELVIVDISLEKEERKPKIIIRGDRDIHQTEINDLLNNKTFEQKD